MSKRIKLIDIPIADEKDKQRVLDYVNEIEEILGIELVGCIEIEVEDSVVFFNFKARSLDTRIIDELDKKLRHDGIYIQAKNNLLQVQITKLL